MLKQFPGEEREFLNADSVKNNGENGNDDLENVRLQYHSCFGSITLNNRNHVFLNPNSNYMGYTKHFAHRKLHLIGIQNFIVEVDTEYIKGMLANPDIVPSASINHWILSILMFHFTLVHVPSTHRRPDKLSRQHLQPGDEPEPKDDLEDWIDNVNRFMHIFNPIVPRTNTITDSLPVIMYINKPVPEDIPELEEQSEKQLEPCDLVPHSEKAKKVDDRLALVQNWLETLQQPDGMLDPEYKMFMWYCMEFFISSEKLWCKDPKGQHKMIVAKEQWMFLITMAHNNVGHHGFYATIALLSE